MFSLQSRSLNVKILGKETLDNSFDYPGPSLMPGRQAIQLLEQLGL